MVKHKPNTSKLRIPGFEATILSQHQWNMTCDTAEPSNHCFAGAYNYFVDIVDAEKCKLNNPHASLLQIRYKKN